MGVTHFGGSCRRLGAADVGPEPGKPPELGEDDARRGLLRVQLDRAWAADDATLTTRLVLHAAKKLRTSLGDSAAAFDALKRGVANAPGDGELLDAIEAIAVELGRLDALDAHLARLIAQTQDPDRELALLRRRGTLQLDKLDRAANAADSFAAVLALAPDDEDAANRLATALERAGRYQELVRALEGRLARASEVPSQVELLRRLATLWEVQLKNRPNALDRWNQLRELAPEDSEAAAAITRLQT